MLGRSDWFSCNLISISNAILPVFLAISFGYMLARWNDSIGRSGKGLVKFVYWVALPSMLFTKVVETSLPSEVPWNFLAAFYIPSIIIFFMAAFLARSVFSWKQEELGIAGVTCCYGNLALLGLPIILNAFDPVFLTPALILIASQSTILFGLTIFWLEKKSGKTIFWYTLNFFICKVLGNPIVLSLILGFSVNLLEIFVPSILRSSLDLFSIAAPGCSLFALGVCLAGYQLTLNNKTVLGFVFMRNFFHPLLVLGLCVFLGVPNHWKAVAVLFAAMPTGINAFIFAEQYELRQDVVSMTIILSTIVSMFTLTILVYLFRII